jgi:hypothetical protein
MQWTDSQWVNIERYSNTYDAKGRVVTRKKVGKLILPPSKWD